jgi:hypothetical protein
MTFDTMETTLPRLIITLAALTAWSLPALAAEHIVDIAWDAKGQFHHEARVAPKKFVEVCGKLAQGTKVRWHFEGGAPMDFNVHYHEGKDVRFPAKQAQVSKADGTVDVSVDQDYCWMWSDKSETPVSLMVHLDKGG